MPMSYHETISILDTWEPDTPPSRRFNRIVSVGSGHVLELRDPSSGQGGGPEDKPRHQYARARGLWTRRLPPESVGEEWQDGPARWEHHMTLHIRHPHPILEWSREGHEFPLVVMRRQRFYSAEDDVEYMIRGEYVDVDSEGSLEWPCGPCIASLWDVPLPPCPDCGGDVVWWEAGYVPGTRRCVGKPIRKSGGQPTYNPDGGCGSMFAVDVRRRSMSDRPRNPL